VKGARIIAADVLTEEDILGIKRRLIVVGLKGIYQISRFTKPHTSLC
jgi:hypothetical protein